MHWFRRDPGTTFDPQLLLPTEHRAHWAVVPRFELYQVFAAAFILGAGVVATVVGAVFGPAELRYGFPVALLVCYVQAALLRPRADRLVHELGAGGAR